MKGKQLKLFSTSAEKGEKQYFMLSPDMICISAVIAVLLLIVSFVLGMKKGRHIASVERPGTVQQTAQPISVKISSPETEKAEITALSPEKDQPEKEPVSEPAEKETVPEQDLAEKNPFTIQVASFRDRSSAEKEKAYIEEQGLTAEICQKGDYLVIFVGRFPDKEAASARINELKQRYKDCFARRF